MKQHVVSNRDALRNLYMRVAQAWNGKKPLTIYIGEGVPHSEEQQGRYWATLDEQVAKINNAVEALAEYMGETNMAARLQLARELKPELACFIYALDSHQAHTYMKLLNNYQTSTRLTKTEYARFTAQMEATTNELLNIIQNIMHTGEGHGD